MKAYKKDQGRHVRMAAYWAVVLLVLFGCVSLNATLVAFWPGTFGEHRSMGKRSPPPLRHTLCLTITRTI